MHLSFSENWRRFFIILHIFIMNHHLALGKIKILWSVCPETWNPELGWIYFIIHDVPKKVQWCLVRLQNLAYLDWDITWKRSRKVVISRMSFNELVGTLNEGLEPAINWWEYERSIIKELIEELREMELAWIIVKTWEYPIETNWIGYFNSNRLRNERYNGMRIIPRYELNYYWIARLLFLWNREITEILDSLNQDQLEILYKLLYNSIKSEWIYPDIVWRELNRIAQKIQSTKKEKKCTNQKIIYWTIWSWISIENKYTLPFIE